MTTKVLEAAIGKVAALPLAEQERIGREILAHLEALAALRADLRAGVDQLDAGLGEALDIEGVITDARREHAGR